MAIGGARFAPQTIVIAHRLSTIRRADLILLVENGRIIEQGNHETLMHARGDYHRMVQRQMTALSEAGGEVWRA
jgi:ABC-type multidrug transport system fused ATPase/permease subunit